MKVVRLARIEEMKRALLNERKAIRRRDREIGKELELYESLEGVAEEVESGSPASGTPSPETATLPPPTLATKPPTVAAVTPDTDSISPNNPPRTPFMRQPRSEGSPVSKVQNRVWELVSERPGVTRTRVMEIVATAVGTSTDSVRESIRRMVNSKKLRMENDRLFPNVEPADDSSRQPVLEIAGDRP
jgi:hypothetical protein